MLILIIFLFFIISLGVLLIFRHRKDMRERKKHELKIVSKSFLPPATRNKQVTALKIHLLLAAWLLKKNSVYSSEKEAYVVDYVNQKFKISEEEARLELLNFTLESIHIRSVANWVISSLKEKEERMELIEFLICTLYASKTDLIDREFTALVRFAELIGVHADYVEKRIIAQRKVLLGEVAGQERWHKFTNKQVRRKLALAVFDLLGDATEEEVKKAYRSMVKRYHPDRQQGKTPEEKAENANKFLEIQEAYEELGQQEE